MRPFFPREHGRTCGLCFIPTCSRTHRAESLACAGETEATAITSKVVTARRSRILAKSKNEGPLGWQVEHLGHFSKTFLRLGNHENH
jgi:hypothetical protein